MGERSIASGQASVFKVVGGGWQAADSGKSKVDLYHNASTGLYRIISVDATTKQFGLNNAIEANTDYVASTPTFHNWIDLASKVGIGLNFSVPQESEAFLNAVKNCIQAQKKPAAPAVPAQAPNPFASSAPKPAAAPTVTNNPYGTSYQTQAQAPAPKPTPSPFTTSAPAVQRAPAPAATQPYQAPAPTQPYQAPAPAAAAPMARGGPAPGPAMARGGPPAPGGAMARGAPPPPPAGGMKRGGGPPPPGPAKTGPATKGPASGGGGGGDLASQLANAKLKKTAGPPEQKLNIGNEPVGQVSGGAPSGGGMGMNSNAAPAPRPQVGGGGDDFMAQLKNKLNKRAAAENSGSAGNDGSAQRGYTAPAPTPAPAPTSYNPTQTQPKVPAASSLSPGPQRNAVPTSPRGSAVKSGQATTADLARVQAEISQYMDNAMKEVLAALQARNRPSGAPQPGPYGTNNYGAPSPY